MKRTLSKSLAILMMVFITLILWGSTAKAAGASIGVSKSTVTEGESITVTVNFGEMVKSAQMIFSFNSTNLEYKGSNGTYNPATKKYSALFNVRRYINYIDIYIYSKFLSKFKF